MSGLLPPLTAEDLAALLFVSDAQMSPDGARVAFVLRTMDVEGNAYRSRIWTVPAIGDGAARELTAGPREDAAPRWSPDGRWLAFVSDSDESLQRKGAKRPPKQLYVMPAAGGEPRRLTAFDDDALDPAWSPRSDSLVVALKDAREADDDGPRIRVYDRARYKTDEGGLWDGRRKHLWLVPLEGVAPRRLTEGDWDDSQPAYAPDGASVAFTSNRTDARDTNTVADIWVVALDGAACRRVTDGRGSYGNASWSPDGLAVLCYGVQEAEGSSASNVRLWRVPATGGTGTDLLGEWDRTVGSVVMSDVRGQAQTLPPVSSDGRLVFIGTDQGTANLYSVGAAGGDLRAETLGEHQVVSASFDARGHRFAAVLATATDPGEVAVGERGGALRRMTSFNDELLASRFIAAPERVCFSGADGWTIEGWLMRPRGFDPARRWPLVLEVHGGPHAAYGHAFFHEFQVLAGRGYAVLFTNPRGSHGYGETFVRACVGDWGGKDQADLLAGLDHALALGWIDAERLYLTGGSYGGFMTNWIVGHTERFRAAATQRSISNNVSAFGTSDIGWHFWEHEHGATPWRDAEKLVARSPLSYVERIRTPLLILHAENDLRCPIEQAEQLFVALKVLGREAVFVRYPDDTHDLTRAGKPRNRIDHCRRIADWFDAHP